MKKCMAAVLFLCILITSCGTSENSQERLKAKADHLQMVLFSDLKKTDGDTPSEGDSVLFDEDAILLDGSSVESAQAEEQKNSDDHVTCVLKLKFTEEGSNQFARITSNHIDKQLAIIIDGKLISAPTIQEEINGGCIISGNFTKKEAESYAALFND